MNVKISIPNIGRMKMEERLFFFTYSLYMVFSMLVNTFFYAYITDTYKYVLVACILLLIVQEVFSHYMSKRALIGAIMCYAVVLLVMVRASGEMQKSFACVFAFALGARNISFKNIGRFTVLVGSVMIMITVASALLGIIPNYHESTFDRDRYYLGYLYSLYGPAYMLNLTMLITYLDRKDISFLQLGTLLAANGWLYWKTNARLSFTLTLTCLVIAAINKIRKDDFEKLKIIPVLLIPSYIVSFLLSLYLTISYNPGVLWQNELNKFLGGRLRLGQLSLMTYGISILGNSDIEWVGNGLDAMGKKSAKVYNYVDNLYLQFLQRYGIIFMILFLIITTAMMLECYRRHMYLLELMFAIIAFHGIIDNLVLYLHYNTFWLFIGPLLFGYIKGARLPGRRAKTGRHAVRELASQ